MLEKLSDFFSNSSVKILVELYLFPLLILVLILKFYDLNNTPSDDENLKLKHIIAVPKFDKSYIDIMSNIKKKSLKLNVKLHSISNKDDKIKLLGKGALKNVVKFIRELEYINKFSNIDKFFLEKKEKKNNYGFNIELSFQKFYFKEKIKSIDKKKKTRFKLHAIIDNYILIDNKILTKNEKYKGFVILKVESNKVTLEKDGKEKILRINNEIK